MRIVVAKMPRSSCPQRQCNVGMVNAPDSEVIAGYLNNFCYRPERREKNFK